MHRASCAGVLLVLPLAVGACSQSVGGGGDSGGTLPADTAPGADVLSPAPDAAGADVVRPAMDAATSDGGGGGGDAARDAPPPDAFAGPLAGRWRVVAYEYPAGGGATMRLTDENAPVSAGGVTFDLRVNGVLQLAESRLSLTFGALANDHFYALEMAADPSQAMSAYGYAAAGVLRGDTFAITGGEPVRFVRNADGTVTARNAGDGTSTTFARADAPPGPSRLAVEGRAQRYMPGASAPGASLRVALAWDLAGPVATAYAFADDQPLAFDALGFGRYVIDVTAPPPAAAVGAVDGASVALAYVIAYDDVDGSGRYEAGGADVLRARSSVGVAWRDGAGGAAFARSAFRDLEPGLQLVHLHPDYSAARPLSAAPFDPARPVAPDVVIETGASAAPLPDLIR